jgi:group I intron endonuclease
MDKERIGVIAINGIYVILSLQTNRVYIGESRDADKRIVRHKTKLNHNAHFSLELQKDWNEYGPDMFVFSVIESGYNFKKETRLIKEEQWMDHYEKNTKFKLYNIRHGECHISESGRLSFAEKMSKRMSGENHPMWGKVGAMKGKKRTEEFKKKVSDTLMGHSVSEESRKKMSESHIGKVPKSKFPTTDEVVGDIKNGISYKDFTKKYGVTVNVIIRIKRELKEANLL